MTFETIKKPARQAAIALVAAVSLSACDDTMKPLGAEPNSIPTQANEAIVKSFAASQPSFRAAGEGKDYEWGKDHIFIKLSRAETGGILTLIQDNLKPGFNLDMHFHRTHTEIFYILEGEVEFKTIGKSFAAKTGSVVYLPAGTPHAAKSSTGGKMLMFYAPGGFDEMLAEIENASWFQRLSPFAKARRQEKYDFNDGAKAPVIADAPEPKFVAGGEGQNTSLETGNSTVMLSSAETGGLATVIEETLKPGLERISSLPGNQAEVLYVLDGELEFNIANKTQVASKGATLYLPAGVRAKVKSPTGAKFLAYRTLGAN